MAAIENTVVCDNGSGYIKCGFSDDNFPRVIFPCMVGRPSLKLQEQTQNLQDLYVGENCMTNRSMLEVSSPMRNGVIHNWDDMALVWQHAFQNCLKINPSETKIMLTDPALNPVANRERIMQIMFEKYGFKAAYMQVQAVLTLYSQGLMDGLVIDSGDGVSHAVPVVGGFAFPHCLRRLNIAGHHITSYLLDLLLRRGYAFTEAADFEDVRIMKESLCYVAYDFQREAKLARETTHLMQQYVLPDGRTIKVGAERFMAPELLFNPSLLDVESPGLAEMAFNSIQDMDIDNRMTLYQHVVISGGSTMYPGLPTRMEKELRTLFLDRVLKGDKAGMKKLKLKIEDPPNRKVMVFMGGAVLADLMKDREDFWVTREEYQEDPMRALKKCGVA